MDSQTEWTPVSELQMLLEEYDVVANRMRSMIPRNRKIFDRVLDEYIEIIESAVEDKGDVEKALAQNVIAKFRRLQRSGSITDSR